MTKPKNPYDRAKSIRDAEKYFAWKQGHHAGLLDGERKLIHDFRKWAYDLNKHSYYPLEDWRWIDEWLTERLEGKK